MYYVCGIGEETKRLYPRGGNDNGPKSNAFKRGDAQEIMSVYNFCVSHVQSHGYTKCYSDYRRGKGLDTRLAFQLASELFQQNLTLVS